jgi:hypothetical protein
MQALISPDQPVVITIGWDDRTNPATPITRIIENSAYVVEISENPFQVSSPLFWKDCDSAVQPYTWYFDLVANTFNQVPPQPAPPVQPLVAAADQPYATNVQSV